jgi:hypothetical protein
MFSPSPIPATTPGNSSNGKKFFFSLSSKCVRTSDKTCNDCRHFKVSLSGKPIECLAVVI